MHEIATVNRYCAIEDKFCEKQFPYKGTDTFFFAYPSSNRWRDFTSTLVDDLSQRGFHGERWEDFVKNDFLFSKVCNGIFGHDYLLAEVTEPNANVLLEIGYALAVGRLPILLQDKNLKPWPRRLLTTLENCHYETRTDIHQYINSLRTGPREVPQTPDRRLPFLENMGIFLEEETRGTVYHLKPKQSADWISRVDKVLKRSHYKLSSMDPSDSVYDEFYSQARQIQHASLIVASLLSENNRDYEQQNANVSLLIGFAIGLGKQVLVLQHEPLAPILDLGSVARPIETEIQAERIVQSWIDKHTTLSISEAAEFRRLAQRRDQTDQIRSLYLGPPDALQDHRLLDYFVPTKEYQDAVEGRRTLFIGRRGSGKSANFQAVTEELRQSSDTVVSGIAPDDFELERISAFVENEYAMTNPKLVFQNMWNYVLMLELLKSLSQRSDLLYTSPDDLLREYLRQYYDSSQEELSLDFGRRVIQTLNAMITTEIDVSPEKRQANAEQVITSLRDYDLGRRLKEFAIRENITFFIVADDLDKHWRPESMQSIDLLIGLIDEVDRLKRFFGKHLNVVLFLREDIYSVLARYDDDLPKRNLLRLEWTQSNLKHLVARRLDVTMQQDTDDDNTTWVAIFPEKVEGKEASTYILSRSRPRPRDVLDLCQKSIDQAQRNGHGFVTAQDILDGERAFSDGLFWSLSAEFKGLYPQLEDVLFQFAGIAQAIGWSDFKKVASVAIATNQPVLAKWVKNGSVNVETLLDILFTIGLLGLSRRWGTEPHFSNGRTFSETWAVVGPNPIVHIHPAFRSYLEVSRTEARGGLRPNRQSRVDPRQLAFE